MKTPQPLEKEVLKACRDYLRLTGWLTIRLNSGAVRGEHKGKRRFVRFNDTRGCSDLIAVKQVTVFIEIKRPGGKLRPEQVAFLEDARRHGAAAICVSSLEELQRELEQLHA